LLPHCVKNGLGQHIADPRDRDAIKQLAFDVQPASIFRNGRSIALAYLGRTGEG
jgi:hypothetical protein